MREPAYSVRSVSDLSSHQDRRRRLTQMLLLLLATSAAGCATLIHGTHQEVRFRSDPPGATASVSRIGEMETPGSISMDRSRPARVVFKADGHRSVTIEMERRVSPAVLGNVFCLILPGMLADFLTGAAFEFDSEVYVELEPIPRAADERE